MNEDKGKEISERLIKFNIDYKDFMNLIRGTQRNEINEKNNTNTINNSNILISMNSLLNDIFFVHNSKYLNCSIYESILSLSSLSDDPLDLEIQLDSIDKTFFSNKNILLDNSKEIIKKNPNNNIPKSDFIYTKKVGLYQKNKINQSNQSNNISIISERKNSEIENKTNERNDDIASNMSIDTLNLNMNKSDKYEDLTFQEYLNEEIKQIKRFHSIQTSNDDKKNCNINKEDIILDDDLKEIINQSSRKSYNSLSILNPNLINLNILNNNNYRKKIKTQNIKKRIKDNNLIPYNSNSSYLSYNNVKKFKFPSVINYSSLNIIKNKKDKYLKKNTSKNPNYHSFRKGLNLKNNRQEDINKNYTGLKKFTKIQFYENYKRNSTPYIIKQKGKFNKDSKKYLSEQKINKSHSEISYRSSSQKSLKKFDNYFNKKPKVLKTSVTTTNLRIFDFKKRNNNNFNRNTKSIVTDSSSKESMFNIKIDIRDLMKDNYDEKLKKFQKSKSEKNLIFKNNILSNLLSNENDGVKNLEEEFSNDIVDYKNKNENNDFDFKSDSENNEMNKKSLDTLIISKQKVDKEGNIIVEKI